MPADTRRPADSRPRTDTQTNPDHAKIGVIGDGDVGGALSKGLEDPGHEVQVAGHDPKAVEQASQWAEIVLLAVPFTAVPDVAETAGHLWTDKIVIDVTNAVASELGYVTSSEKSGAERLQELVPEAKVVKAFNTVFAEHMATGELDRQPLTALVASDHEEARKTVISLAEDIGFDAASAGTLENARWLEAMGYLNIEFGYTLGMGTDFGFKIQRD